MGIIHYMNVKEGDCIWIKHLSERNTIIDISNGQRGTATFESLSFSGNHNQKNHPVNPIEYLKARNVSSIFRFILTHPDMDHMDGIKALFETYEVLNFWDTANAKIMDEDSDWGRYDKADWDFYQKIRKSSSTPKVLNLYAGQEGRFYNQKENGQSGADGLYLLAPTPALVKAANETEEYNDCSYVILYRTGDNKKVIFAGDSAEKTWDYILKNHAADVSDVDLLIAPHHGRKTGGNDDFLDVLKPKLTLFGNAKSEYLDYSSWNNRKLELITNNQANCIIINTNGKKGMDVYVTYEEYAKKYNPDTVYNETYRGWYIKTI